MTEVPLSSESKWEKLISLINEYRWSEAYELSFELENEVEAELLTTYGEPNRVSEKFDVLRMYMLKRVRDDVKARECRRIIAEILRLTTPFGIGNVAGAEANGIRIDVVLESLLEKLDRDIIAIQHVLLLPSGLSTVEAMRMKIDAITRVRNTLNAVRKAVDSISTDRTEVIEVIEKLVRPSINEAIAECLVFLSKDPKASGKLADSISEVKEAVMKLVVMLRHPERSMIVADSIRDVFSVDISSKVSREAVEAAVEKQRSGGAAAVPGKFDWVDEDWQLVLQHPRIYVILGHRGSGKSAAGHAITEFLKFTHNIKAYFMNVVDKPIPPKKLALLPNWMEVVNDLDEVANNSVVLVDEAYIKFHARTSMREAYSRAEMDKVLELSRQKVMSLIFVTQSTTKIDKNIIEATDTFIIKSIHHNRVKHERHSIRSILEEAYEAFKSVPRQSKVKYAYVFSDTDGFAGLKTIGLPSYWNEELSRFYEGF